MRHGGKGYNCTAAPRCESGDRHSISHPLRVQSIKTPFLWIETHIICIVLSEKIGQLKLQSSDGKYYKTDIADQEHLFRLIQSIPSPKAEPFKIWMATVASERLDEMQDPELTRSLI